MSWVVLLFFVLLCFLGWLGWVRRARQQQYRQIESVVCDWATSRGLIDVNFVVLNECWGFPDPSPPRLFMRYRKVGEDPELVSGTVVNNVFEVAQANVQGLISEEDIEFDTDDALVLHVARRVKELSPEPDWIEQVARLLDRSTENSDRMGAALPSTLKTRVIQTVKSDLAGDEERIVEDPSSSDEVW